MRNGASNFENDDKSVSFDKNANTFQTSPTFAMRAQYLQSHVSQDLSQVLNVKLKWIRKNFDLMN